MQIKGRTMSGAFMLTAGCWINTVAFKQVLHFRLVTCRYGKDGLEGYKAKDWEIAYVAISEMQKVVSILKKWLLRKAVGRSILQLFT